MTREDIIRMAREAGINGPAPARQGFKMYANPDRLERFASLVADAEREKYKWDVHSCGPTCQRYVCVAMREAVEAEREACAKVCEELHPGLATKRVAEAIRARSKP